MKERPPPVIQASEIGLYTFCHRAWWLQRTRGYRPLNQEALAEGSRAHARHGRVVAGWRRWQRAGWALLALGGGLVACTMCQLLAGA